MEFRKEKIQHEEEVKGTHTEFTKGTLRAEDKRQVLEQPVQVGVSQKPLAEISPWEGD